MRIILLIEVCSNQMVVYGRNDNYLKNVNAFKACQPFDLMTLIDEKKILITK
jgi:hypothetical protein